MTDSWPVEIRSVGLKYDVADCQRRLGMVLGQPLFRVRIENGLVRIHPEHHRDSNIATVKLAFRIREHEQKERELPIPFVVFPEFSLPFDISEAFDTVLTSLKKATGSVVFISGVEGLDPSELDELQKAFPPATGGEATYQGTGFVNVCVVAIKYSQESDVAWYYQAKLAPSQWEAPINMAEGTRVLYFHSANLAFACQVCFDHIARRDRVSLNHSLCSQLADLSRPAATPLDYLFVPQYNSGTPQHPIFRERAEELLTFSDRALQNRYTAIVSANVGATGQEPGEYGGSGLQWPAPRWSVSYKDVGPDGYELTETKRGNSPMVTSAVFRKRTHCVHVATLVPPTANAGDPGDPRQPMKEVNSYIADPPACDGPECLCKLTPVPELAQYVRCEPLPCKLRDHLTAKLATTDSRWKARNHDYAEVLKEMYMELRAAILSLPRHRTEQFLDTLFLLWENRKGNPDTWADGSHADALRGSMSVLSIVRSNQSVTLTPDDGFSATLHESCVMAIVDGRKVFFCREVASHYWRENRGALIRLGRQKRRVILVASRSLGAAYSGKLEECPAEITQPPRTRTLDDRERHEERIYELDRPSIFICKDDLIQQARDQSDPGAYIKAIMEPALG